MKKHVFLLQLLSIAILLSAQNYKPDGARPDIQQNHYLSASVYTAYNQNYELSGHQQTAAPEGYEPYYVSTYMRHGSRWLTQTKQYDAPIWTLERLDSLHRLTKTGQQLLKDLKQVRAMAPDEAMGVLTQKGFEQHQQIATRMCENFPGVFNKDAQITARSSAVARCVKSMAEEVETIQRLSKNFYIQQESGTRAIQHALANWDQAQEVKEALKSKDSIRQAYEMKHVPIVRLKFQWLKSPTYLSDEKMRKLVQRVFTVASNMQSHEGGPDLYRYFTDEECYELWRCMNVDWYLGHAYAPQTKGMAPYKEVALLEDFLEDAMGKVSQDNYHGASLRFGHDGCILPLLCLMQVEGVNARVENLDTLDNVWRNYEIVPMAANVQVIFYRKAGDDILVKLLLNEREVKLPLEARNEFYYRWEDVKTLWEKVLTIIGNN